MPEITPEIVAGYQAARELSHVNSASYDAEDAIGVVGLVGTKCVEYLKICEQANDMPSLIGFFSWALFEKGFRDGVDFEREKKKDSDPSGG